MKLDLLADITEPAPFRLDISGLPRGIDNYHVDVRLSTAFCNHLDSITTALVSRHATMTPDAYRHEVKTQPLRECYADMMTVLFHRTKTGYNPTEVSFVQFAVIRQVLESSRQSLDAFIDNLKQRASELRLHGSGKALPVHEHLRWLSSHYSNILYTINREIGVVLLQSEKRELRDIRRQYCSQDHQRIPGILFNPLLMTTSLSSSRLLADHYFIWSGRGRAEDFMALNQALETLLAASLPALDMKALLREPAEGTQTEFNDILGGLRAGQSYLGTATDSRHLIQEWFCWLDHEDNMDPLFSRPAGMQSEQSEQSGFSAWRQQLGERHRQREFQRSLLRTLEQHDALRSFLASDSLRRFRSSNQLTTVNPDLLMQHLCGQLSLDQLQQRMGGSRLSEAETRLLKSTLQENRQQLRREREALACRVLKAVARFRRDLKYHRLAHRLFNRLRILTSQEDIALSQHGGSLYQLPIASEIEQNDTRVVHHTILKADVRGSTTVIEEMDRKGLNAASFFSLRFFNPINKVLPDYGAEKVFIEGDAIILSFLEYEDNPHQWYSVAHACGLARAILRIVRTNNQHSRLMGLPPLELGIGICHADSGPRFLFDEDKPIMISSAIGLADRLSSSDRQLRELIQDEYFNVDVLEIDETNPEQGRKGQSHLRYNIDGILLDEAAFRKLQSEMSLTRFEGEIGGRSHDFFYGRYPDRNGRDRGLLVRRGTIRRWHENSIQPPTGSQAYYYEVVSNPLVYSMLQSSLQAPDKAAGSF